MGGIVKVGALAASTAASAFGNRKAQMNYYRSLASDVAHQSALTQAAARRQATYLFKTAAERNREVYASYRQTQGTAQSALASSGLTARSATVQDLLNGSRFQALLDEETLQTNLQGALAENELSAAQQLESLNQTASQYRRAAQKSGSWWRLGSQVLSLFK